MDQILGQSRAVDTLLSSVKAGRLHHAYIFHGPQGVGKFTTARQLAKLVLCQDPQTDLAGTPQACDFCASCKLFSKTPDDPETPDNHPDLHVISKELARYSDNSNVRNSVQKTIAVDTLRQFMVGGEVANRQIPAVAGRTAQLQRGRFFIIDEAELMDTSGQNAILKTVEEPPPGVKIILITANENKLLQTIRSRCQRVPFSPIPDSHISSWVTSQPEWQGEPSDLQWLVEYSAGSLGRARLAVDYNLTAWSKEILPMLRDLTRGEFNPAMGSRMSALMSGFAEDWVKNHKNASKDAANKVAAELMWSLITQQMRKAIKARAAKATPGSPESVEELTLPYARAIEAIDLAERELHANVNVAMVCDHAVSLLARALAPATAQRA
jgi:DNA polymerase III subunit delta'